MPGPRYTDWTHVHVRGDRAAAAPHVQYGRKMLGYLAEQRANGGKDAVIERQREDGTHLRAEFIGEIPRITITPAPGGGALEEVEFLYVSASDGLRIYDLGTKQLAQTITGLGAYLLQAVSPGGLLAWMTFTGINSPAVMARVDIKAFAASGMAYAVKTVATSDTDPPVSGSALNSDAAQINADNSRLLMHFGGSGVGGVVKEGVGGVLLLDPTSLLALREPIRMSFVPAPMAWTPDGTRFFVGTSRNDDVGDLPATSRLNDLTTSPNDYVCMFDKDGALLGSRQLSTWAFTPSSGFSRMVLGIVATDARVYVSVDGSPTFTNSVPTLYVLDATDAALPILASLDLSPINGAAPPNLCLTRDGKALLLSYSDRVAEVDVTNDEPAIVSSITHTDFVTWAPTRNAAHDMLQLGPLSRFGGKPDDRRFFFNFDTGVSVVRAYRSFVLDDQGQPPDVYEIDLATAGIAFKPGFRLASVGTRPQRKSA